jgi:hypothetical protein
MKDYSESLIKLKKLMHQYQNAILKGQYNTSADIAVDMQIAVVDLQEWSEAQVEQSTTQTL